jgi:transposase
MLQSLSPLEKGRGRDAHSSLVFARARRAGRSSLVGGDVVHVDAVTTRHAAHCPLCGRRSHRVHSHYSRTVTDLPCCGAPVVIHLHTRRFVCRVRWCKRKVFTERIPALVAPSARRTVRLRTHLERTGFALGGAPGARHATAESIAVSRRTLLRLVRAAPLPERGAVRALGVDDWAQRKGQRYGTILVKLEAHRVIRVPSGWHLTRSHGSDRAVGNDEVRVAIVQVPD